MARDDKSKLNSNANSNSNAGDWFDQTISHPLSSRAIPPDAITDTHVIEDLFAQLDPDIPFVASVYEWYLDKGFLTLAQYEALNHLSETSSYD